MRMIQNTKVENDWKIFHPQTATIIKLLFNEKSKNFDHYIQLELEKSSRRAWKPSTDFSHNARTKSTRSFPITRHASKTDNAKVRGLDRSLIVSRASRPGGLWRLNPSQGGHTSPRRTREIRAICEIRVPPKGFRFFAISLRKGGRPGSGVGGRSAGRYVWLVTFRSLRFNGDRSRRPLQITVEICDVEIFNLWKRIDAVSNDELNHGHGRWKTFEKYANLYPKRINWLIFHRTNFGLYWFCLDIWPNFPHILFD